MNQILLGQAKLKNQLKAAARHGLKKSYSFHRPLNCLATNPYGNGSASSPLARANLLIPSAASVEIAASSRAIKPDRRGGFRSEQALGDRRARRIGAKRIGVIATMHS